MPIVFVYCLNKTLLSQSNTDNATPNAIPIPNPNAIPNPHGNPNANSNLKILLDLYFQSLKFRLLIELIFFHI